MPVTILEIIQDAVKIGLGALIGGGISLLTEAKRFKRDRRTAYFDRKREVFEEAANDLGDYFSKLNNLGHRIHVHLASKNDWDDKKIRQDREQIESDIEYLQQQHHKITSIYSSMLLYSEENIANSVVEFTGVAQDLCPFDKPVFDVVNDAEKVEAVRAKLRKIRSNILAKMAASISKTS